MLEKDQTMILNILNLINCSGVKLSYFNRGSNFFKNILPYNCSGVKLSYFNRGFKFFLIFLPFKLFRS